MARETSKAISSVLSADEDFVTALMALKSERMDFSVISYKAFIAKIVTSTSVLTER